MSIPSDVLKKILADDFYKQCCICGEKKVQFHHQLAFEGKSVQEKFCILPLCKAHHDKADERENEDFLNYVMILRASHNELEKYSKARDLFALRDFLYEKYKKSS